MTGKKYIRVNENVLLLYTILMQELNDLHKKLFFEKINTNNVSVHMK